MYEYVSSQQDAKHLFIYVFYGYSFSLLSSFAYLCRNKKLKQRNGQGKKEKERMAGHTAQHNSNGCTVFRAHIMRIPLDEVIHPSRTVHNGA